jgi:hypothetical protein
MNLVCYRRRGEASSLVHARNVAASVVVKLSQLLAPGPSSSTTRTCYAGQKGELPVTPSLWSWLVLHVVPSMSGSSEAGVSAIQRSRTLSSCLPRGVRARCPPFVSAFVSAVRVRNSGREELSICFQPRPSWGARDGAAGFGKRVRFTPVALRGARAPMGRRLRAANKVWRGGSGSSSPLAADRVHVADRRQPR